MCMKLDAKKRSQMLRNLVGLPDEKIDVSDVPLLDMAKWRERGVVGKFYRPIKQPVTLRLDADVLAWLRSQGKGYQTRINELLRSAMVNSARGVSRH